MQQIELPLKLFDFFDTFRPEQKNHAGSCCEN